MIKQATTFVIGAGASNELGLPLGSDLRAEIGRHLSPGRDAAFSNDAMLEHAMHLASQGAMAINPNTMHGACRMLAAAMPNVSSIDNFINNHSGNGEVEFCGKLAIARIILAKERSSALYRKQPQGPVQDTKKLGESYLPTLFNLLQEGVHRNDVEGIFADTSFVIFNYDRCVEQYLQFALEQSYGLSSDAAGRIVDSATIVHPYGAVGRLPWQSGSGHKQRFGADDDARALVESAKEIMTFGERVAEERFTQTLAKITSHASRIVFLGMAYHQQNLDLLRSEGPPHRATVYGTALGLSAFDREIIEPAIETTFKRVSAGCHVKLMPRTGCAQAMSELARTLAS